MLNLLWVILLLVGAYLHAAACRRKAIERFIVAGLLSRITVSVRPIRRFWKAALVLLTLASVVLALSRPGWNQKPKRVETQGRDVVFLLDVSRSMLAEDLAPNRLERAKLMISDCAEQLQGDRVALVAFAGNAVVKCPLTLDYGFFRLALDDTFTDSVGRGGTMIGDAIRKTLSDLLKDRSGRHTDIILITDGGDQGSFPVEAAQVAGERGVRIIAIGLGDEKDGSPIPLPEEKKLPPVPRGGGGFFGYLGGGTSRLAAWGGDEAGHGTSPGGKSERRTFLKHQGQEVWSKLDADALRQMAEATPGGVYFNVATGAMDLGTVYRQVIAFAEKQALTSPTRDEYEEEFQVFLSVALVALCLEWVVAERRPAP
jgi:Ca-activated chloride channel family protein